MRVLLCLFTATWVVVSTGAAQVVPATANGSPARQGEGVSLFKMPDQAASTVSLDLYADPNAWDGETFDPFSETQLPEQPHIPAPSTPPGARPGVFQKLAFSGTWLPSLDRDGLGMSDLDLAMTFGFPLPTRESPLLVTPFFAVHYFDGPVSPDLPPRVYDATVEFRWFRPVTDRLSAILAVEPGVHGDFETDDSDAFRVFGRGLAIYDWTPSSQLVLGVIYLEGADVTVLPAGGLIWIPHEDWRWELVMPRPKIARRFYSGTCREFDEYWAYVGGDFGWGVWSIDRANGVQDTVRLRDYRVLLGFQHKVLGGISRRVEVGYVFSRKFEYGSSTPDFEPDDTLMLRIGANY